MRPKIAFTFPGTQDRLLTHVEIRVNWNPWVLFIWTADKSHLSGGITAGFWKGDFLGIPVKYNLINFAQNIFPTALIFFNNPEDILNRKKCWLSSATCRVKTPDTLTEPPEAVVFPHPSLFPTPHHFNPAVLRSTFLIICIPFCGVSSSTFTDQYSL